MRIEDLERILIQVLRSGLAQVKTAVGQTGEWIYVDYPRMDCKMPRISLTLTSSIQSPLGIGAEVDATGGTLGVLEETVFDIDIWIHRTNKTTGLTPVRAGTSLRDFIADEIVSLFLSSRATFNAQSDEIIDVEKIGEMPIPYDEEKEIFRKTITIRVTHKRLY